MTYLRMKMLADNLGKSVSGLTEDALRRFCDWNHQEMPTEEQLKLWLANRHKRVDTKKIISQNFTF